MTKPSLESFIYATYIKKAIVKVYSFTLRSKITDIRVQN